MPKFTFEYTLVSDANSATYTTWVHANNQIIADEQIKLAYGNNFWISDDVKCTPFKIGFVQGIFCD